MPASIGENAHEFRVAIYPRRDIENQRSRTRASVASLLMILEKSGKTIEGISRVNDHAKGGYTFGFKFLLLGFFDGTMLIPADFSLHRESQKTNFGLTKEERGKQYRSRNPKDSHGEMRKCEHPPMRQAPYIEPIQKTSATKTYFFNHDF